MPNNTLEKWEEKTIKQLTTLICDGDWIESKNQSSSGIRLIQTGNVGNGYYKDKPENARYISEDTFKKLNCTEIYSGDCLVSRLPEPLGRACLIPDRKERMITAVDCSIIRFNDKLIVPKYFIYYSMSNLYHTKIINLSTGATRQRISRKNLETITIPVPKIEEQQRIVGLLDEAFENIEKAKQNTLQNLNNAKELFENSLNNIFNNFENSCNFESLQNIYDVINGYSFKSQDFNCNNSIRVVKITNVGVKEFVEEDNGKLPKDFIDKYKNFVINANDIVIALTRTIISSGLKVAIVPKSFDKSLLNQRVACIKSTNKNCGKYLYYYLQTHNVYNYVKSKVNELMQPNLSINDLKNIPIPAVNYEIQNNIVSQLDELQEQTKKLEQIYTQKLQDLDELKQSILQKAFNGEL